MTDHHGKFSATGAMPDAVLVQITIPAGLTPSTSNGGFEYHTLSSGQDKRVLFGLQPS